MTGGKDNLQFLALGTFVKLKDFGDQLYLVVARAVKKDKDVLKVNYRVAEHPDGDKLGAVLLIIAGDQVKEVIHEGYKNKADDELLQTKIQLAERAPEPEKVIAEEIPEPDFSNLLKSGSSSNPAKTAEIQPVIPVEDSKGKLKIDPFYKFRT